MVRYYIQRFGIPLVLGIFPLVFGIYEYYFILNPDGLIYIFFAIFILGWSFFPLIYMRAIEVSEVGISHGKETIKWSEIKNIEVGFLRRDYVKITICERNVSKYILVPNKHTSSDLIRSDMKSFAYDELYNKWKSKL